MLVRPRPGLQEHGVSTFDVSDEIETLANEAWEPMHHQQKKQHNSIPHSSSASGSSFAKHSRESTMASSVPSSNSIGSTDLASYTFNSALRSTIRSSSSSSISSLASTSGLDIAPAIFAAIEELRESPGDGALVIGYVEVSRSPLDSLPTSPEQSPALDEGSFDTSPRASPLVHPSSNVKKQFKFEVSAQCSDGDVVAAARQSAKPGQPQGLVIKVAGRTLFCHVLPSTLAGVRKARALVHGRNLISALQGSYDASTTVSSIEEVTLQRVLSELDVKSEAYATHRLAQPIKDAASISPPARGGSKEEDAPPPLPQKDEHPARTRPSLTLPGLSSLNSPQLLVSPSSEQPTGRSPIVATNDLQDLQDRWSQSNASGRLTGSESLAGSLRRDLETPIDDNRSSKSGRSGMLAGYSLVPARWSQSTAKALTPAQPSAADEDNRSVVSSSHSRTPSPRSRTQSILQYDPSQERVIKHPIDKPLPVVQEKGESILGSRSSIAPSRTPRTSAALLSSSSHDHHAAAGESLLSMPNPHSRKESMWIRSSGNNSAAADVDEAEQQARNDFASFLAAEKARVAELEREDERRRQRRKQREDEKKRQDVLKRLEQEQQRQKVSLCFLAWRGVAWLAFSFCPVVHATAVTACRCGDEIAFLALRSRRLALDPQA